MKKFLAILLTVCLLASMFTFAASAAEAPAVTRVEVINSEKVVAYFNQAVDASADGAWAAFYFSADGSLDFNNRLGLNWASTSEDRKVMTFTAPSFNAVDAVTKTGTFAGNAAHELYFAFDGNGMGSPVISSDGTAMSYDVTIANWGAKAHTSTNIAYEPVEITGATVLSDKSIALHFSEAVTCANFNGVWFSVAYKSESAMDIGGTRVGCIFESISADSKTVYIKASDASVNFITLYEADVVGSDFIVAVDGDAGGSGYPITAIDGYGELKNHGVMIPTYQSCSYTDNVIYTPPVYPEITGVKIVDEGNLTITFDDEIVNSASNDGPWAAFYLVNKATGALVEGVGDGGGSRIGVAWKEGVSGATINYKSDNYNLVDLFYRDGAFKNYGTEEYELYFAVDNLGACPTTFATQLGVKLIANTALPALSNAYALSDITCDFNYSDVYDASLKIEEVSFINSGIVAVEFSEKAIFNGQPWGAFYFRDKATGALVGERIGMSYRNESATGDIVYYVSGTDVAAPTQDAWDAYNRTGAYETYAEDKYDLVFAFDNYNVAGNGTVSAESGLLMAHNDLAPGNGKAHACDNVTDSFGYVDPAFEVTEGFRVVSATAINKKQIVIEMSEPVHMEAPYAYISLRYTDNFGYLVMDGATPLQFDGSAVISGDGMRITWTINEKGNIEGCNNVIDAVTFAGKLAKYSEYVPMMSIEEIKSIDDNGTVAHVFNDEGEELIANRVYSKAEGGADAAYVPVAVNTKYVEPELLPLEIPEMKGEGPKVVKAVAVNDKQIVIEFSEPITFIDPYGFISVRYVDRNFNLGFEGDKPLQFYGAAVVSLDRKSVVWTLAEEGNIGDVQDVMDIIHRTGALSKYKNYYAVMGIEEIIDGKDTDAYIENVVNDKGQKLIANCPTDLGYDRVYVNISVDTKYQIPDTSDNINIILLFAGLLVPVAVAGAVVVKRKRTQA